ncbi:hypothetical protein GOODEAATRI_006056, partial [Goodea atripinnis]
FPALLCSRQIPHWLQFSGQTTLLLPPDQPSLPNPWIRMPVSASPFMTLLLCSDLQFNSSLLLPDSVLPALTLFLFSGHRIVLSHWVCRPDSPCDVTLLLPDDHTEEPKFSFLILPQILRRGSCAYRWWFPAKHLPESSINLLKCISCVRLKFRVS